MVCVFGLLSARGGDRRAIGIDSVRMVRTDSAVSVSFVLRTGDRVVRNAYSLTVTPVVSDGASRVELPAVMVRGRRAAIAASRGEPGDMSGVGYVIRRGDSVSYTARVPFERWMVGAQLALEGAEAGCCSVSDVELGLVTAGVLWYEPQFGVTLVEAWDTPEPTRTTGDMLATQFPFVRPDSELDGSPFEAMPPGTALTAGDQKAAGQFVDRNRDGSVTVYFRQGRRTIDRDYMGNNLSLVEVVAVARAIERSCDSRLTRVVIGGFASPEGTGDLNDRLGAARAAALRDFLTAHTSVPASAIYLYNGAVDWTGLRELVAGSRMPARDRVLAVIDGMPVWDTQRNRGRLGELMRLDRGDPYRYMMREFFPFLRQAAFIRIYYENIR